MVKQDVYVLFLTWILMGEDYMMWSVDYKSPDVSLHKTLQFRSLTELDCSIATVSIVTMLSLVYTIAEKSLLMLPGTSHSNL